MYDAISAFLDNDETRFEQYFVDIARQFGKTFIGVLIAVERALRNPGWRVLYTAPTRTELWQLVQPNIATVLQDCPADLRPKWNQLDSSYHFENESIIHLAGVNNGHEDDARGPRAHLVVNEELGFVDRVDYLVTSIELPMLTTTGGRIIHITTPAETPAHESTERKYKCRAKGNYIQRTLDDNKHLTDRAKEKIIEEAGGRESTQAQRELFCKDVVDASRAIVPEFAGNKAAIVREPDIPEWYFPLVAMDVGFEDLHAVGFGYWDFGRAQLVLLDELYLRRATTDLIASGIRAKERELWPWLEQEEAKSEAGFYLHEPWRKDRRRIFRFSDTDLRLIADLTILHKLAFSPTRKDELEAQVNELRIVTKKSQLVIHPRCINTIAHLEYGIWNKQRTEFERTKEFGHFDGAAMMVYMLRNAPRQMNPVPAVTSLPDREHVVYLPQPRSATGNAALAARIYGR